VPDFFGLLNCHADSLNGLGRTPGEIDPRSEKGGTFSNAARNCLFVIITEVGMAQG